jgi:hypothetical protein
MNFVEKCYSGLCYAEVVSTTLDKVRGGDI